MRSAGLRLAQILFEPTSGRCWNTAPKQFPSNREGVVKKTRMVPQNPASIEKRISDRHRFQADMICAVFNTDKYFPARMGNYGQGGLYFESATAVKPGTTLFIRLSDCPVEDSACRLSEGFRTTTLGEVRWCAKLAYEDSPAYGFGVKYYQPYQ